MPLEVVAVESLCARFFLDGLVLKSSLIFL